MKETNMLINCNNNVSKIEYIGYYDMLDKLVELIDKQPEYISSIIQSYEKILELIVRLKESENKCQN